MPEYTLIDRRRDVLKNLFKTIDKPIPDNWIDLFNWPEDIEPEDTLFYVDNLLNGPVPAFKKKEDYDEYVRLMNISSIAATLYYRKIPYDYCRARVDQVRYVIVCFDKNDFEGISIKYINYYGNEHYVDLVKLKLKKLDNIDIDAPDDEIADAVKNLKKHEVKNKVQFWPKK